MPQERQSDLTTIGPWRLNTVHNIDCVEALRRVPDNSLDITITSPPYWGQRENGGIGSEPDPREYIKNLTAVLLEVMRCLKPTGTLWLNIGDAYNTPINWRESDHEYNSLGKNGTGLPPTNQAYIKKRGQRRAYVEKSARWLQYGNLLAIPSRVIIAMSDAGILYRGEVIWEKSRPLPEGRCRRPHRHHEGIYIFAKDEHHSFRVKPAVGSIWRLVQTPNKGPHCSTFPLDLPIQCIKAGMNTIGGVVCDPFMGSGTTAKAAQMLGHHFLGFELDKSTCEFANRFLGNNTQVALL